jgi:K+-transporting ATPase ATPase B chain
MTNEKSTSIFERKSLLEALKGSIKRLNPIVLLRNPVMLIVEIGAIVTTLITLFNLIYGGNFIFNIQISIWLWFTVIFSNFAESLAEARGKARAQTLKNTRTEAFANKIINENKTEKVPALSLRKKRHSHCQRWRDYPQ